MFRVKFLNNDTFLLNCILRNNNKSAEIWSILAIRWKYWLFWGVKIP